MSVTSQMLVVMAEWAQIPRDTLRNLVESVPRRVVTVIATNDSQTPY